MKLSVYKRIFIVTLCLIGLYGIYLKRQYDYDYLKKNGVIVIAKVLSNSSPKAGNTSEVEFFYKNKQYRLMTAGASQKNMPRIGKYYHLVIDSINPNGVSPRFLDKTPIE